LAELAPHETLELNELIGVDISEVKTLTANIPNVRDAELRDFLNKYLNTQKNSLEAIQKLVDVINQKK